MGRYDKADRIIPHVPIEIAAADIADRVFLVVGGEVHLPRRGLLGVLGEAKVAGLVVLVTRRAGVGGGLGGEKPAGIRRRRGKQPPRLRGPGPLPEDVVGQGGGGRRDRSPGARGQR